MLDDVHDEIHILLRNKLLELVTEVSSGFGNEYVQYESPGSFIEIHNDDNDIVAILEYTMAFCGLMFGSDNRKYDNATIVIRLFELHGQYRCKGILKNVIKCIEESKMFENIIVEAVCNSHCEHVLLGQGFIHGKEEYEEDIMGYEFYESGFRVRHMSKRS